MQCMCKGLNRTAVMERLNPNPTLIFVRSLNALHISRVSTFTSWNLVRLNAVIEYTGLARSTIYNFIAEGRFPKPVKLSARIVAWVETEVQD